MYMYKMTTILVLALVISFSAMGESVFIYPTCFATPTMGECTLMNSSDKVVNCNVQMQGVTRNGRFVSGYQSVTLYQRATETVNLYVYGPFNDPLMNVTANANCNTVD